MRQPDLPDLFHTSQVELDRSPAIVDVTATVADALAQMCSMSMGDRCSLPGRAAPVRASYVLVMDGEQLVGIFTERDVLRLTVQEAALAALRIVDCMSRDPITLPLEQVHNPLSVLTVLRQHGIRHLPVVDGRGRVVGLATAEKLRQSLRSRDFLRLRSVADVMSPSVITAAPTEPVLTLVQRMVEHCISCVVVVEPIAAQASVSEQSTSEQSTSEQSTGQRPIGILTERDIVQMQNLQLDLGRLQAADVMSAPLVCIPPSENLWEVQQQMLQLRVRRLVVADGPQLVGLITQSSILSTLDAAEMYQTIVLLQTELDQLREEREALLQQQNERLQQQVETTERRFEAIFNNTFQFTGLLTPGGMLLEVNQTALDFAGLQREDVVRRPVWEAYWWAISPQIQQQLQQAIRQAAEGEFIRYETQVLGRDRQVMWIDFSIRPLRDAAGQVVVLIPEGRDITPLKRTQAALQFHVELEHLLAELSNHFVNASIAEIATAIDRSLRAMGEFLQVDMSYVFEYAPDYEIAQMTHEWRQKRQPSRPAVLQVPRSAFPWSSAIITRGETLYVPDVDDLPPAAVIDQQSWQQHGVRSLLTLPLSEHGAVFGCVGFASRKPQTWSGQSIQILKFFAEILTSALRRQQQHAALQLSDQRFRAIFDNVTHFIGLMRLDGTLIEVNQTALDFAVVPREAVLNRPIWDTYCWTISPQTQAQLQAATERAAQGEFVRYEVDVLAAGDQPVTLDISIRPLLDAAGQVVLLIPEGRDITAFKQNAREIQWQAEFDRLVAAISNRLIQADAATIGRNIEQAFYAISDCVQVDASYTTLYNDGAGLLRADLPQSLVIDDEQIFTWQHPEWQMLDHPASHLTCAMFPWMMQQAQMGRMLHLTDLDDLPPSASPDRENWQVVQLRSLLLIPFFDQTHVYGFVVFVAFRQTRIWPDRHIQLLTIFAETITNALQRQATTRALQQNEERLRLALTAAQQGLYDLHIPSGEAIVSPEYATMLGYDPATFEETNAKWIERIHPDDRAATAQTYQNYIAGRIPEYKVEFRQRKRSGDWRWILSLGKVVEYDAAGAPLRMLGTHTDITALKQAESLKGELRILSSILETAFNGYWDWDIRTNIESLSASFKQKLGYGADELVNQPGSWEQLLHPDDLPHTHALLKQHFQSHGAIPFYNEVRYRHRNGPILWMICAGQVIDWDDAGNPLRMVGAHVDITHQKQTEAELRRSDLHLKAAQRIANLGSWEWDLRDGKVTWSDEVFRIFGRDLDQAAPTYEELQEYIYPDDWAYFDQTVQAAVARRQAYEVEYRVSRPQGAWIYVLTRGEMVHDESGQLIQVIGTVLDITDRKMNEARLQQLNQDLQRSNQELEQFAYVASHDLQEPLRAIVGYTRLLAADYGHLLAEDTAQEYLDYIVQAGDRMRQLIRDLLAYSVLGWRDLAIQTVDCHQVLNEVIQDLRLVIDDAGATIEVAPLTLIQADPRQIYQLFLNLLSNAIKFRHPERPPMVQVDIVDRQVLLREQPQLQALNYAWYFCVCDNGIGIKPQYYERIFDVFRRLHPQSKFPGTGIGLAICKKVVERHGGEIWLTSEVDQGTKFYFALSGADRSA